MKRPSPSMAALAIFLAISVAVYMYAPVVKFTEQWPLYEALRTTASIIFAVIGAWIAIAFPERLRLLTGSAKEGEKSTNGRMLDLFAPVVHSTIILCVILIVGVTAPILKGLELDAMKVEYLLRLSFGGLVFLTLWQVWTVVLTLIPADVLKTAMDRDISAKRSREAVRGLGATMEPPKDDE